MVDRTCAIGSNAFNITSPSDRYVFFRMVIGMCRKTPEELGYIPQIVPQESNGAEPSLDKKIRVLIGSPFDITWYLTSENRRDLLYRLEEARHLSETIIGKSTVCWKAVSIDDGSIVAVKRSFHHLDESNEADTLREFSLSIPTQLGNVPDSLGLENVVRCRHSFKATGSLTRRPRISVTDKNLQIFNGEELIPVSSNPVEYYDITERFNNRHEECRIVVLSPFGEPLTEAKSYIHALGFICDAIRGHEYALEKHRVLHGNIAFKNVLIANENGREFGFLTGFGLAGKVETSNNEVAFLPLGDVPY